MLQPIATLIVGLAVAVIAFLQFKVAHDKLRLELFDKRYKVYDATRRFLSVILHKATFEDSHLFEFYTGTADAEFLFDTEIRDYLKQIRERAIDMRLKRTLYQDKHDEERTRMVDAEHQHLIWLSNQLVETGLTKVFAPYLSYAKIKGNFFWKS
jgi:hypothetical protein